MCYLADVVTFAGGIAEGNNHLVCMYNGPGSNLKKSMGPSL